MTRLLFGLLIAFSPQSLSAEEFRTYAVLSGVAHAIDGDDVAFGGVRVRLRGIAAPEDRRGAVEPGGPEATLNLAQIVNDQLVICHLDGTTTPGSMRPVGICFVDGQDIGRLQVRAGHARDCPAYSGGMYSEDEVHAQVAGNDLSEIYLLPGYCH